MNENLGKRIREIIMKRNAKKTLTILLLAVAVIFISCGGTPVDATITVATLEAE